MRSHRRPPFFPQTVFLFDPMSQITLDRDPSTCSSVAPIQAPHFDRYATDRSMAVHRACLPPQASPSRGTARITVLLGDERTLLGEGLVALLHNRGNLSVVGHAPSYADVATLAEKLRPNVVIVSFSMAIEHGVDAVRSSLHSLCGASVLVLVPRVPGSSGTLSVFGGCLTEQSDARGFEQAILQAHENHLSPDALARRYRKTLSSTHPLGHTAPPGSRLTSREWEVLHLVAQGSANKQTAATLGISIKTVEKHRQHVMEKVHIHHTAGLTRYALCLGMAG